MPFFLHFNQELQVAVVSWCSKLEVVTRRRRRCEKVEKMFRSRLFGRRCEMVNDLLSRQSRFEFEAFGELQIEVDIVMRVNEPFEELSKQFDFTGAASYRYPSGVDRIVLNTVSGAKILYVPQTGKKELIDFQTKDLIFQTDNIAVSSLLGISKYDRKSADVSWTSVVNGKEVLTLFYFLPLSAAVEAAEFQVADIR